MLSGKYRIVALSILFFLSAAGIIFGGTTGKIAGRVVDKENGEPLPGVSVLIKGTTLGASTDPDGYYTILQIPPGVHTVVASMIGYTSTTVDDIGVHIDQTSTVDIQLVSEVIEMNSITVIAQRNIIKKDVSTSVSEIRPDEIRALPVKSITEVIGLQAGVENGLVIRGASADELLFQLDGVTLRDPRNNKPITAVSLTSIQEVSVERGGFNAEYGQVRSGIINIVGKEGDASSYSAYIQMQYSPPTQKYFGTSVFDPSSMWNRPYLDPQVAFVGTEKGWDEYTRRQYPVFAGWNSISQGLLTDNDPNNDLTPEAAQKVWEFERRRRPPVQPDYNLDASFGGPVPFIGSALGNLRFFASYRFDKEMLLIPLSRDDYREDNWSLKLNSSISNTMSLMLTASTGITRNVALNAEDNQGSIPNPVWNINNVQFWNATDYIRTPFEIAARVNEQRASRIFDNSWYSTANVGYSSFAGKLSNTIGSNTFYEISFENVNRKYNTGPIGLRDFTKKYEVAPGIFVNEAPDGYDPATSTGITGDFFGGHSSTSRDSSRISSFLLKADLTSQYKIHWLKTGIEFSYYDLNLQYGKIKPNFVGENNYVKEQWFPYRMSAYAQDKIEAFGFIANLGLRLDMSNPNADWVVIDAFNKTFYSTSYDPNASYPKEKAKVDVSLSPRLGISHPITEHSKLYFNYGHFKQFPAYEQVFRLSRGVSGGIRNYGDPNLVQAKTISYELGFDQELWDSYLIQIAAFYNDVSNQQGFTSYLSDRKGIGYFAANSNGYADTRGLEITLKKSYGEWIHGFATYTYLVTTNGAFGKATIDEDPSKQIQNDQNTPNLYQQKPVPRPRANLSVTFLTPKEFGPELLGTQPLSDWSINVLATWKSGEWINYNPNIVTEIGSIIQNVQVSDNYNVDLRLMKSIDFSMISVSLFVEVRNLLNSKFLSGASFYDSHDVQWYMESLHLPQSRAYNNIPGDDRVGTYRKEGVPYQPIEQIGSISGKDPATALSYVIYYDKSSQQYMNVVNGKWAQVDNSRLQKVLDDKAYIDMPNNSSFDFLNPRQIFFGLNLSFKL